MRSRNKYRTRLQILFCLLVALLIATIISGCGGSSSDDATALSVPLQPSIDQPDSLLAAELARLEALQTPAEADPAVFAALKVELAGMLLQLDAGRMASAPPMLPGSQAQLSWISDASTLTWGYSCSGDYNQDSLVGVNDITPLGQNYLADVPADPNSLLAVVDGNGNGKIEVADITPIGQNFQARVTAYNVYASSSVSDFPESSADDNGAADLLGSVPFPEGPPPAGQRRMFSFAVTDPQAETYFWVRPTDGSGEGTPSNYFYLSTPPNQPPVAALTADPLLGDVPMIVEFDASASHDPDGTIAKFEWDWDGADNGWVWEDTGTTSVVDHTFEAINTYSATVRVTDNEGESRTASVGISATAPGNDPPVAVLTADVTSGEIPLTVNFSAIQSSDPDGTVEDYEWDLDGDDNWGEPGNEAAAAGSPVASYTYEATGTFAATVRVTDNEGAEGEGTQNVSATRVPTGDWVYITLDSTEGVGDGGFYDGFYAVSLAVIDGKPAISYGSHTSGDELLKFVSSPNATGVDALSWNEPVVVDSSPLLGTFATHLAEIAGCPAISYLPGQLIGEEGKYRMAYARASTPSGSDAADWDQFVDLASDPGSYGYPVLAVADGNPAVAYTLENDEGVGTLVYRRSTTTTGASLGDWSQVVTFTSFNRTSAPDLVIAAGNPSIAFFIASENVNDYAWWYIHSSTRTGAAAADWSPAVQISEHSWVATRATSIVNGNPAFLYKEGISPEPETLVYTRSETTTGENEIDWNLRKELATGVVVNWFNLAFVGGSPAVTYSPLGDTYDVRFAQAYDSTGASWGLPEVISDPAADGAGFSSLAEVAGNPAVAFVQLVMFDEEHGREDLIYAYYDG